jgi:hypothetical protein
MRVGVLLIFQLGIASIICACASGPSGGGAQLSGNENGSKPFNEREALEYRSAILRCHKTGGSRVVRIEGQLRCF